MSIHSQLMLMFVLANCGSGTSMDLMYPCWIWERPTCKSGSVNRCGHFKRWCLPTEGTVSPDWALSKHVTANNEGNNRYSVVSGRENLYDIYMNEDIVSLLHVRTKLAQFGLICKDLEWLEYSGHVLGLDVCGKQRTMQWRRGTVVSELPDFLIRYAVFSLCSWLVGHLPVCR